MLLCIAYGAGCAKDRHAAKKELLARMSVEDYCKMQKEIVDIGMMKYYDLIKNKKYSDTVRELSSYSKEVDDILKKNNLNTKDFLRYNDILKKEIREYLRVNPEMNWNASPEQMEFNEIFFKFLTRSFDIK